MRQHTSAYVSRRQHTSAYVRIRQHSACRPLPASCQARERQYSYFCTSKASKLRTSTVQFIALSSFSPTRCSINVSIRQHTSAYVSIHQHRQHTSARHAAAPTSAYVSIRPHTSAYVSPTRCGTNVSIRQHTYNVSIRQHTSAYVC
jgi:hypothetical protein